MEGQPRAPERQGDQARGPGDKISRGIKRALIGKASQEPHVQPSEEAGAYGERAGSARTSPRAHSAATTYSAGARASCEPSSSPAACRACCSAGRRPRRRSIRTRTCANAASLVLLDHHHSCTASLKTFIAACSACFRECPGTCTLWRLTVALSIHLSIPLAVDT